MADIRLEKVADPMGIETRSMEIIDSEVPEPRPYVDEQWQIVRRMIHTTADFEMLDIVRFHENAVAEGLEALKNGGLIVTDTEMARMGIPRRRTDKLGCRVECYMNDEEVMKKAKAEGTTRALAAVDKVMENGGADIWVVGNAPTALLRICERIEQGAPAPKLIVGMPVGFVNAAESKEVLMQSSPAPYIAIQGRKGGSPLAACVINALAEIALTAP
ncbi:MAG: precorrin-8X methylmutase [Desulfovibrio sp.]